ncbi:flagellar M-ring protein FliF [Curtobacterium sp. MCBD17_034]|uniref:flagellar basal-body MS-ring/collar protein FliF n=1 Tax=unclassified Curtobacterium TaxID=257496 RepID=UPI000DA9842C|nr:MULTISPECIES: flagellar basal-body MS-ring/collar protein FliF [unclassified Curtobacterium]PZF60836.1 flagellar M-ring protein FliF [Curtobacterium sp. MCBD17_034]PZF66427.1 flagellar M-ring protein FliF [Curtobacterium sp. MCBD17_013]PZM40185.1 flagellar M-ring protein FliF [Curtobacterium sp. MCBD17_031]WIB65006.1 flagellar basal-body MS-ring/collar protein FliF [Curtobacterium sp. MCBD17_040]
MPLALRNAFARLGATLKGFSVAQRTIAVIGIAAVVLGAIALTSWLSKPSYAPLFTGLAATDASSITDQLTTDNVPYQLTDGGATILVPQGDVYQERLKAASNGLPSSNEGGYALLDKMGVTASEFQQNVTYKRAIEGELAKTISAMDGVQTASVQLAIPEKSVFVSETKDPTASVFVEPKAGQTLSTEQVQAIVHLTSAAVEGMQPTDVSVVDAKGDVLSAVGTGTTGGSDDQASDYDTRVGQQVQALLDKVVGAGNSSVVVAATMDPNSGTRTTESFAQPTSGPVALNESSSTESYDGSGAGGSGATGVLGPDNIAVPSGSSTSGTSGSSGSSGSGNGYTNESSTKDNAVDKTTETTTIPAGALNRQTISVALNSKAAKGVNLQSIDDLVANAAGVDQTRGDQVKVAVVDFNNDAAKQAAAALKAADAQAAATAMWSTIRTAAIVGGVVLAIVAVLVMMARRGRRAEREDVDLGELDAFSDAYELPIALDGADPRASLAAADAPTIALPTLGEAPTGDAPTEVLSSEDVTAERRRADIAALAERDPEKTADLLRGLLDDRTSV